MPDINKHLDDLAAGRWDDYKAAFTNDVIYEELATRTRVQGADEYVNVVKRWKRAFPDLKATLLSSFQGGDRAVAEIEWEGTQSGPLEGPFGTIQATNKKGRVRAVIVMTMKGDKIAESHHYFDLLTVLAQTGALPALGAMQQPTAAATPRPEH
jgi:steroid delta-isomerase-like uncharacterized protein